MIRLADFKAEALRDVQACIGCNDCMLKCPIVNDCNEISIAQLNEAVLSTAVDRKNVREFVERCTQCQQCVSVCPADLSRANMVLFNKHKLEAAAPDRYMAMAYRDKTDHERSMPTGWTLDELTDEMAQTDLFQSMGRQDLRRLLFNTSLLALDRGELLFGQGKYHEQLYVVLDGAIEQRTQDDRGQDIKLLTATSGDILGVLAVMADCPESYDARAKQRTEVLRIPKAVVRRFIDDTPSFSALMDTLYKDRAFENFDQNEVLSIFSESAKNRLMEQAELRVYPAGTFVLKQEEPFDAMYVVRSGFIKAWMSAEGDRWAYIIYL